MWLFMSEELVLEAVDLAKSVYPTGSQARGKEVTGMNEDSSQSAAARQSSGMIAIFESISVSLKAGESLAIMGASGSGKSTLLAILAGLDEPTAGSVNLVGQALTTLDEDARARLRLNSVGFIFQAFHLIPTLSALENVQVPAQLRQLSAVNSATGMNPESILSELGLGHRLGHLPQQLSGGEQQRVAIARALITQPKILFADEPTGNLDRKTGDQVCELLFGSAFWRDSDRPGLLLVTHDPIVAERCDRQLTLEDGCLR